MRGRKCRTGQLPGMVIRHGALFSRPSPTLGIGMIGTTLG
jgi:hypothetical protein